LSSLRQLTFLLVDSDFASLKTETRILNDMGYTDIIQAENGTEAWPMLKHYNVNFVISAWDLPEMNGLALLKFIRTDLENNTLPVVLIAEQITRKQVIEAGEAGVSDLIIHPISPDLFQKKIKSVIEVDLDPKHIEVEKSYEQGRKLMKEGRLEEALTAFKRILSVFENAEIYYNMGYINTAQGNYDEAIICFRKATQIDHAFARAYKMMGEVYIKLGRKEEAGKALQKAAEIYMDKNMNKNAEKILNEVVNLNPDTINVYNSLGILYRRQGKYLDAIKQYKKAIKVSPHDENIYYNLSRVYLASKDLTNAQKAVIRALQINPEFREAKELLTSIESSVPKK